MKNGELKIEKGVPITPRRSGLAATLKKMKKGDSFFIDAAPSNLSALAAVFGMKGCFARRQVQGGYRIWRIK